MPVAGCLFLFDVDGTLLKGGIGLHSASLRQAVRHVAGALPDENIDLAGRTDSEIVRDMIVSAGGEPSPGSLQAVFELTVQDFDRHCPADISEFVIDGVRSCLERLQAGGGTLGLVTGNIEGVAWRKMASAGLREFFSFGAFGSESARRADLPPLAVMRAGRPFPADCSYVIGDTPRDIDCGQACGMNTVAVATGRFHSLEVLRACRPTFACRNLQEFVDALLSGRL